MILSEARNAKEVSQESLSRLIYVSLKHYQNIEHGITMPTVKTSRLPRDIVKWIDRRTEHQNKR